MNTVPRVISKPGKTSLTAKRKTQKKAEAETAQVRPRRHQSGRSDQIKSNRSDDRDQQQRRAVVRGVWCRGAVESGRGRGRAGTYNKRKR